MPAIKIPIIFDSGASVSTAGRCVVKLSGQELRPATATVNLKYAGNSNATVTLPGLIPISVDQQMSVFFDGVLLIRAPVTRVDTTQKPSASQTTVTSSALIGYARSGSVPVTDIFSRNTKKDIISFSAAVNPGLLPGGRAVTAFDNIEVGRITFNFSKDNAAMAVSQLTESEETTLQVAFTLGFPFTTTRLGNSAE